MGIFETYYGTIERTLKNQNVKIKEHVGGLPEIKRDKTYKVKDEFMGVPLYWHIVVEQINEGKLNRIFLHYITLEGIDGYFEARDFEVVEVVEERESIFDRIKKIIKLNK